MRAVWVHCFIVRALLAFFPATLLGACVTSNNSANNWTVERRVDRMTDTTSPRVYVASTANNNRRGAAGPTIVQLMCFDKQPVVRLAFETRIGINNTTVI